MVRVSDDLLREIEEYSKKHHLSRVDSTRLMARLLQSNKTPIKVVVLKGVDRWDKTFFDEFE